MKFLATALVLMCVIAPCFGESIDRNLQERIGLDPILRGVWTIYTLSEDEGVTWTEVEPFEFAIATATRITYVGGQTAQIKQTFIFTDNKGHPGNLAILNTGFNLIITKNPNINFALVQAYNTATNEENIRFIITVSD